MNNNTTTQPPDAGHRLIHPRKLRKGDVIKYKRSDGVIAAGVVREVTDYDITDSRNDVATTVIFTDECVVIYPWESALVMVLR